MSSRGDRANDDNISNDGSNVVDQTLFEIKKVCMTLMKPTFIEKEKNDLYLDGTANAQDLGQFIIDFGDETYGTFLVHEDKDLLQLVLNHMINNCLKEHSYKNKIGKHSGLYTRNAKNIRNAVPVSSSFKLRQLLIDAYRKVNRKGSTSYNTPTLELSLGLVNIAGQF